MGSIVVYAEGMFGSGYVCYQTERLCKGIVNIFLHTKMMKFSVTKLQFIILK